jgi:hypothetical protein
MEGLLKPGPGSMQGLLEYLKKTKSIVYAHHRTRSPRALRARLAEWKIRHPTYELGYFAGHGGSHGQLAPGGNTRLRRTIYLDDLADALAGKCDGRVMFFATCVTARNTTQMKQFLKTTGAIAVCGYRKSVWQAEAFAADTLIIEALARHRVPNQHVRPLAAFRDIEKNHPWITERLGFVYFTPQVQDGTPQSTDWVTEPAESP